MPEHSYPVKTVAKICLSMMGEPPLFHAMGQMEDNLHHQAGVPTWAIGAGVGGAVVVLLLIFVLLRGSSSSDQNNAPSQQVAQSNVPPPRPNIGNNTRPGQPTFNTPNSTSRTASNKNTTRPQADGFF